MRIAIPTDENTENTGICPAFARAPYFYFYDTEAKEGTFVDNSAAAQSGGAGIKAAQLLVDNKAGALLTPRCGENAAEVLKEANIKLYKTEGTDLKSNIDAFVGGGLSELTEIEAGHHK